MFGGGGAFDTLAATAITSLLPITILLSFPYIFRAGKSTPSFVVPEGAMKALLGFAAGGLLGDVFLHLIPHCYSEQHGHHGRSHEHHGHSHDHDHGHSHSNYHGMLVIAGVFIFFAIELVLRYASNFRTAAATSPEPEQKQSVQAAKPGLRNRKADTAPPIVKIDAVHDHDHGAKGFSGYLNLLADTLHNFTDGLALCAACHSDSPSLALSTLAAIFVHELPHEISDYVILVQSGFSHRKAIAAQVLTAGGAFAGALTGIWLQGAGPSAVTGNAEWILPLTAGGFLYIALTSILPGVLNGRVASLWSLVMFGIGVSLMAALSYFEP